MSSSPKKVDPRSLPAGAVRLEGVTKRFKKLSSRKSDYTTVKSSFLKRLFGRSRATPHELIALKDFNLEIAPGSAIGIIGRNGSGKSTLLKLIAGIYRADAGRVTVSGKVSALIELGAGFHPEFTGRENVYLGGAMYGMSRKEVDDRFDSIVRYAELEEFIDDPVRTYSSGMYMRLGFSVAICCDPDILLVDEVLAVGDAAFVHRCFDSISEFKRRGKTLILVTHDLDSVNRWCDEAIWLDKGRIRKRGEPQWVIDNYLTEVLSDEERALRAENAAVQALSDQPATDLPVNGALPASEPETTSEAVEASVEEQHRWGNRHVEITSVELTGADGEPRWIFADDEALEIRVRYRITREIHDLVFGIGILRADGLVIHGTNTEIDQIKVPLPARGREEIVNDRGERIYATPVAGEYRYRIQRLGLLDGSYYLDVAAHRADGTPFDYHHRLHKFGVRSADKAHGIFNPEHSWAFAVSDGSGLTLEIVRERGADALPFGGAGFADESEENLQQ